MYRHKAGTESAGGETVQGFECGQQGPYGSLGPRAQQAAQYQE